MIKNNNPPSRGAYYVASATWGADAEHALRRSRRTAWIAAGGIGVIALFEALALMLLAPFKTVVPYTILVDRQTGFVQAVDPMAPAQLSGQSALTRSFLAQYVVARESYDPATVQANYQKVASLSAGSARARYVALMQAANPDSPIARFGRNRTVSATVKSVSALNASTALVRFDTMASDANGTTKPLGSWITIVRFRYRDVPMTVSERLINPLGFTVTSYRRDPDTAPAPTSSAVGAGA